jgi:hypothetical protein
VTLITLKKTSGIRIWNLSTGGCLVESQEQFPVGTVGVLHVELEGQRRREWFRVCRVHAEEGRRGTCLLGAEFLALGPAGRDSLRLAARDLHAGRGIARLPGRSSGDRGNSIGPRARTSARRGRKSEI